MRIGICRLFCRPLCGWQEMQALHHCPGCCFRQVRHGHEALCHRQKQVFSTVVAQLFHSLCSINGLGCRIQKLDQCKLSLIIKGIEHGMFRPHLATWARWQDLWLQLVEHGSLAQRFSGIQDEFRAVLIANDSGHADYLISNGEIPNL